MWTSVDTLQFILYCNNIIVVTFIYNTVLIVRIVTMMQLTIYVCTCMLMCRIHAHVRKVYYMLCMFTSKYTVALYYIPCVYMHT